MNLVNGRPAASIGIADRGFNYGDGVFETVALWNGDLQHFDAHLARLKAGCRLLSIPDPSEDAIRSEAGRLCAGQLRGVVKIIITRGEGGRGYQPAVDPSTNRVISLHPWPEIPLSVFEEGVETMVAETRLGRNPRLAGVKHLNRLEQVLAALELSRTGHFEGLMCDTEDLIVEGSRTNVFFVNDATLVTPALNYCGVNGIMRAQVLAAARELGLQVEERDVERSELARFTDGFFTNSILGIVPIRNIDLPIPVCYAPSGVPERLKHRLCARNALPWPHPPE